MIELNATVEASGDKSGRIAGLSVSLTGTNYEKCFECLYPFIMNTLRKKIDGFPALMNTISGIQDMTSDAVVAFLSSFPDSVKETLIKAAFDDILTEEKLYEINSLLAEKKLPLKISSADLEIIPEKD